MEFNVHIRRKIAQYLVHARQAVDTGRLVTAHDDYIAAVNRAYYAIFYAANALLATRGLERSKHSGVIAAFRQHFVKTGLVEPVFSEFYGKAMENRRAADYEMVELGYEVAKQDLDRAEKFVKRIEQLLREMGAIE
jgi:uncharacterized protein (UPF0332 family)